MSIMQSSEEKPMYFIPSLDYFNKSTNETTEISEKIKLRNYKQKRLHFSTQISTAIKNSNIIFICVGTPLDKNLNKANLKYVFKVVSDIKKNLNN